MWVTGRDLALDGVEEADELLMAVALHAAADDLAFQYVEGGEQDGRAVSLVIVGHGSGPALLQEAGPAVLTGQVRTRLFGDVGALSAMEKWNKNNAAPILHSGHRMVFRVIGEL